MSIYRFKLSSDVTNELDDFVKINKYCIPQDFKENWDKWIETKKEMIQVETKRLEKIGYKGDVLDKMYRSARYYLKNKNGLKKEKTTRKKYIRLNKEIRQLIDFHIDRIIGNMKPAVGLEIFLNLNNVNKLIENEMKEKNLTKEDIAGKIKKMYKNRYYIKQKQN